MIPGDERAARIGKYERACERFNQARANCPKARAEAARIIEAAEAEWEEARRCLAIFEKSPGIPLDEYNEFKA